MKYISPKKVRVIFFIAQVVAILVIAMGARLDSMAVIYTGAGIVVLALIFSFFWNRCPHCGRHLGSSWGEYCPYCGKDVEL